MSLKDLWVKQPANMRFADAGSIIQFEWPWRCWGITPLVASAMLWLAFLVLIVGSTVNSLWGLFSTLFLPPVWIGLGLGYCAVVFCVNSTKVTVDEHRLIVTHGPLPFPGKKRTYIEREATQQFTRKRAEGQIGRKASFGSGLHPCELHVLRCRKKSGYVYSQRVLNGVPSSMHCLFVKGKIEGFWKLD